MTDREKELLKINIDNEKSIIDALTKNYTRALADVKRNIRSLQALPETQSRIYQIEYQKNLERQISAFLDVLKTENYITITDYLAKCYETGFVGSAYALQGVGEGFFAPLNQEQVVKAVETVSEDVKLADRIDVDTAQLKRDVISEIQRGFSTDLSYTEIARNISNLGQSSMYRALRIARTEGGRIQCEADMDFARAAKSAGLDVVKIWRSVLDGKTRESHQKVDKEWQEIEDPFSNGLMYPHDPNAPASERCNCRCDMVELPRWYVKAGGNKLRRDNETGEIIECSNYAEFKEKYLNDPDRVRKVRAEKAASSVDREQFRRYNEVLKGIAPDNLQDFYEMKYATPDVWKDLQKKYRIVNQYKIDSGHLTPKQILDLDRQIITEKRTNFTSKYKTSGNIAGVYIGKKKDKLFLAHSKIDFVAETGKYKGKHICVPLSDKRQFKYIDVRKSDGSIRKHTYYDSEAKLFEYLAAQYEKHPFDEITLLSERGMCDSCKGVMRQFAEKYGVKVNAVSNKKVEGDVWKHRQRSKKN